MTPCDLCRGACCESIALPIRYEDADAQRWLAYHGTETPGGIMMDCKCSKLKNGKCSIYQTRPEVCRVFEVGSVGCLDAIRRRRPFKAGEIIKLMEA